MTATSASQDGAHAVSARLNGRSVALVGLMGAGKTTVGRRLAQILSLPFRDSDEEIQSVSRMTIPELFAAYGETEFRALEARVIARLTEHGPIILSTGGGAYMTAATRDVLRERALTIWLRADFDVLMERVARRTDRPLLRTEDPGRVMRELMQKRHPIYAEADFIVQSRNVKRDIIAQEILDLLETAVPPRPER